MKAGTMVVYSRQRSFCIHVICILTLFHLFNIGPFLLAAYHIFHNTLNDDEKTYHMKYKLLISCEECNTVVTDFIFIRTVLHWTLKLCFPLNKIKKKRQKLRYCDTPGVVVDAVVIVCMLNNITGQYYISVYTRCTKWFEACSFRSVYLSVYLTVSFGSFTT